MIVNPRVGHESISCFGRKSTTKGRASLDTHRTESQLTHTMWGLSCITYPGVISCHPGNNKQHFLIEHHGRLYPGRK